MTTSKDCVEAFRATIAEHVGIGFDEDKLGFLSGILERRSEASGGDADEYVRRLRRAEPDSDEWRRLAPELTVGETYFFRHFEQFQAFIEVALPERVASRSLVRRLRILSAGCSSGEEAYSLAILAREIGLAADFRVEVLGIDLNTVSLERATRGRYAPWSLRETPDVLKQKYFKQEGRESVVRKELFYPVSFEQRNLVGEDRFAAESFDVVFCRNVLMYFTPAQAEMVVERLARALAPGGYLFLGHAENLRGLSHDFHLRHTHGTFYYQRRDALEVTDASGAARPVGRDESQLPTSDWATSWIDTIQRTSDRIRALSEKAQQPSEPSEKSPPQAPDDASAAPRARAPSAPDLSHALAHLERERFSLALDAMDGLASEHALDVDALLLRAALLTHSGQLEEGERVSRRLLELDELNAGAHFLLALSAERRGDTSAAAEHDRTASYLDVAFSMPHLHLGVLMRRAGDRATARRELERAVELLPREDAGRILMFGGGFTRDALIRLCRSELSRLGGAA